MNTVTNYEIVKSLGEIKAHITMQNISDVNADYIVEMVRWPETVYRDTRYNGKVYFRGCPQDIAINGWTFSFLFNANVHCSLSYCETSIISECITPGGGKYQLKIDYGAAYSESRLAAMYIEKIHTVSLCLTTEEFEAIEDLYCELTGKIIVDSLVSAIGKMESILAEADPSRADFCTCCKNLIRKGKSKLEISEQA